MSNMDSSIIQQWKNQISDFDQELKTLFKVNHFESDLVDLKTIDGLMIGSNILAESIQYALFTGGKRFRPLLTYASCQVLNKDFKLATHWAMAIECIHTYSLIHDDLPCMDNDDERRGQPTVHKKFNEATALLAGDALLTEAFGLVSEAYKNNPHLGSLISLLVERAGFRGMVSGQANDLSFDVLNTHPEVFQNQQLFIHLQKTAALISASCLGPFYIFNQSPGLIKKMDKLSLILGLLFQLKDDFLDANDKAENNMVQSLGDVKVKSLFSEYESQAKTLIKEMPTDLNLKPYLDLMDYNSSREL